GPNEKTRAGTRQLQTATKGTLPADTARPQPPGTSTSTADDQPGQAKVDLLPRHAAQVGQELLFRVSWPSQPDVAGVLAVAASPLGAGLLEKQHTCASVGCCQRSAEGGVATTDHENVRSVQLASMAAVEISTAL